MAFYTGWTWQWAVAFLVLCAIVAGILWLAGVFDSSTAEASQGAAVVVTTTPTATAAARNSNFWF